MVYHRFSLTGNPGTRRLCGMAALLVAGVALVSACAQKAEPPALSTETLDPGSPTASPQPTVTPPIPPTSSPTETALPTPTEEPPFSLYESILADLGEDFPHNEDFLEVIQADQSCEEDLPGGEVTLLIYDVTGQRPLAAVLPEKQMPVASAFKGPLLLYALSHIDPEIWTSVPVRYWSQTGEIPEEYLALLREHWILSRMYDMIVTSSNKAAGDVLGYVNVHSDTALNALEQFNTWSREVVGVSPASGLSEWDEGQTAGLVDSSYGPRSVTGWCDWRYSYANTYSARDLALYYAWLYDQAPAGLQETAYELLGIVEDDPNYIESAAISSRGTSVSKGGIFGGGGRSFVWVDAGLIVLEDQVYLVATSTLNASDRLAGIYALLLEEIQEATGRDSISRVNEISVPDWAAALAEISTGYITETHAEASLIAREIDYLPEMDYEDASLMCAPLAGAMLQDAGVLPEEFSLASLWLGDPVVDGRPWVFFDEEDYYLFGFRSREQALNRFDFEGFPLLPGDVLYTYGGTGEHLFLVVEVDQGGRAYTVNNNCLERHNCPIQRLMLYDLSNPGTGAFYKDYQEGYFTTGLQGFDLLRSKDYPQIFSDWYFRYLVTDWGS